MDLFSYPDPSSADAIQNEPSEIKNIENIQALTLTTYTKTFILEQNVKFHLKSTSKLLIDRINGRFTEISNNEKNPPDFESQKTFSAFLGIINILDKAFLLMVDEVSNVGSIEGSDVFQLATISFIPFDNESEISSKTKDITNYIQILRKVLSFGFYFSNKYDLTLSRIKLASNHPTDTHFQWNAHMFKEILAQNIDKKWQTLLIQGFFGYFSCFMNDKKLDYYLISRRSCRRAGTRYNARGIDDDGDVANFVETETLIFYNQYCCSHVQIRGSVPVFWQQRGITAQTKITRTLETGNSAFLKHFNYLMRNYTRVLCVNLMARSKTQEQMITDEYENHIIKNNLPNVRYEFFDFHHACKGQKFDHVNPLIKKLQLMNENFRFYVEDTRNNTVIMTQKGVCRTNCLDCLDRTNFFMTKVSAILFEFIMKHLGVDLIQVFGQDIIGQMDNNNFKQNHPFIVNFKNIWADNGDYISKHYTGTGSTHTNITRTGKRDFMGLLDHGMKSLGRFYKQNFEDNLKQEAIDMILGQHTETHNVFVESLDKALKKREKEFTKTEEISVFIATWNVNGFEPPLTFDLSKQFFVMENNPSPDIVVICLQDAIIFKSVMPSNNDKIFIIWSELLTQSLKKIYTTEEYVPLKEKESFGSVTFFFLKSKFKNRVSKVASDAVKVGMLSNRGSIAYKLFIDDTSFCFINCHLESGTKNIASRISNIKDIHTKAFQIEGVGKKKEEKIESLDYKFLIGDMNFAINLPDQDVRQFIEAYENNIKMKRLAQANDILKYLISRDEFVAEKKYSEYLEKYQEASIIFMPTARYENYSTLYNISSNPAWYDRIIIWAPEGAIIKQHFYNRKEYLESTHRPVTAYYILEIKKINNTKKEEIIKQFYESEKIDEEGGDESEEEDKLINNA